MPTLYRNPLRPLQLPGPVFATIGNFDGLHRGHQALCSEVVRARAESGSGTTMAISFYPHPDVVLKKVSKLYQLTLLSQKLTLLGECGIEHVALLRFTPELASLRAVQFIDQILCERLGVQHLVVGPDARVGLRREGTPEFIAERLAQQGRSSCILPFVDEGSERVSSQRIRESLANGDVRAASRALGRRYRIVGRVKHGVARGKCIGIPTANIAARGMVFPRYGVYAGWASVRGTRYAAVANVGVTPTFGAREPTLEAHLLEYHGEPFYREVLLFEFVERIRDEMKFSSVEALRDQIALDKVTAREFLTKETS